MPPPLDGPSATYEKISEDLWRKTEVLNGKVSDLERQWWILCLSLSDVTFVRQAGIQERDLSFDPKTAVYREREYILAKGRFDEEPITLFNFRSDGIIPYSVRETKVRIDFDRQWTDPPWPKMAKQTEAAETASNKTKPELLLENLGRPYIESGEFLSLAECQSGGLHHDTDEVGNTDGLLFLLKMPTEFVKKIKEVIKEDLFSEVKIQVMCRLYGDGHYLYTDHYFDVRTRAQTYIHALVFSSKLKSSVCEDITKNSPVERSVMSVSGSPSPRSDLRWIATALFAIALILVLKQ